jgi:surface protein
MFASATNFNGDLSAWNTHKVTGMPNMFAYATNFNRDISGWNTGNVTNMSTMFSGATNFNSDISRWNTSKVTTMQSMFENTNQFNQFIGNWEVSKVSTFAAMFKNSLSFNGNLSGWSNKIKGDNIVNVSTKEMFYNARAFNNDSLNGWNVTNVTDMTNMFGGTSTFVGKKLGGWKLLLFSGGTATKNTYYNTFYTVSNATPTIMTRTIYDNSGALIDTIDISFGGRTISDTLALMNSGGTNPFTIGLVDSSRYKIKMDLAYCNVYSKALTTTQKNKLMSYTKTAIKEPYTIFTSRYIVTVSGGSYSIVTGTNLPQSAPTTITLTVGKTYIFDLSDSSNTGRNFRLSSTTPTMTAITSGVTSGVIIRSNNNQGTFNAFMSIAPASTYTAYLLAGNLG